MAENRAGAGEGNTGTLFVPQPHFASHLSPCCPWAGVMLAAPKATPDNRVGAAGLGLCCACRIGSQQATGGDAPVPAASLASPRCC